MELQIHYCPGRVNQAADALSRLPLQMLLSENRRGTVPAEATILPIIVQAKDGEARVNQVNVISSNANDMMAEYQDTDPDLKALKSYLVHGELPGEKKAREFVLGRSQFEVIDGVLYHVERDKTLQVIPPKATGRSF